ncbi:MAG: hypothetical protein M5U13_07890 [Thermoanaerobaculia bacterium]|nr:hypothetical protein [Thermoanaerobaculia bacterium]
MIQAPGRPEEAVTEYAYDDCAGNLTAVWDPLHPRPANPPSTTYAYDELDRLVAVTQPWGGNGGGQVVTNYAYDVQDHLVRVTDGEGNATEYTYSDRDLLTREDSPVSGVTEHAYTEHGELRRTTDARAVTVTRTVDAADRVTFVDYPDDDLDRTYTYGTDPLAHELGRLVAIANATATVEYGYDAHGRLTQDGALLYAHDENGSRTAITYPGGLVATYAHDDMDRELSLTVQPAGGAAVPVVTASPGASYRPFGPLAGLTFGTVPPTTETRGHDFRYTPTAIALSGGQLAWTYTTDLNGNVLAIDDTTPANQDRSFGYQPWQQYLASTLGPWGWYSWTYDRIGNRQHQRNTIPGHFYSYVPNASGGNTPILAAVSFDLRLTRSYEFDDAGFLTRTFAPSRPTEPTAYFTFDAAGTLTALDADGKPLAFAYDGRGLLARAMLGDSPYALPTYSSAGQLLSLHDLFFDGSPERRTHLLYFAARPVAQWREEAGGKGGGGGSPSSPPTTSAPPPARWPATPRSPGRAASSPSAATGSTAPPRAPSRAASSCASPASGTTPTGTATCAPKASAPISSTTSTAGTRRGRGRYVSADPLKRNLAGIGVGIRSFADLPEYGYSFANPLRFADPLGLCSSCDECPSGEWYYNGVGYTLAAGFGFGRSWGTFTCIGSERVKVNVTTSCAYIGAIAVVGAGGETNPSGGIACACNSEDFFGPAGEPVSFGGSYASWGPFSVGQVPSGECGSVQRTYGVSKSWGLGGAYMDCTMMPRRGFSF